MGMEPLGNAKGRQARGHAAAEDAPPTLTGTKLEIAEAALETLKEKGFTGASAREVAGVGGFNQALIFYHFGSVRNALLAALDLVSARRMHAYQSLFEQAQTLPSWRASPAGYTTRISRTDTSPCWARWSVVACPMPSWAARWPLVYGLGSTSSRASCEGFSPDRRLGRSFHHRTWHSRSLRCTWASTCSAT